jgi:hypothetical protein
MTNEIASEIKLPPSHEQQQSQSEGDHNTPLHSTKSQDSHFIDTWSILRFIKTSQGVSISPNGLTCTVSKGSSKSNQKKKGDAKDGKKEDKAAQESSETSDEVLVLTNTGLTVGFHFWEIIASISCRNIKIGVFNPITKTELLTSF